MLVAKIFSSPILSVFHCSRTRWHREFIIFLFGKRIFEKKVVCENSKHFFSVSQHAQQ